MAKIGNNSIITKKAKKKYFSENISLNLINYNPNSILKKAYWNTYHCSKILWTIDKIDFRSTYCKNRWCPTCQSIRVAVLLKQYQSALNNLDDCYFVTLTRPTVEAHELPEQIKSMNECWRAIYKRANRNKMKLKGCRKSECTLTKGKYHFHFHVVVQGKSNAYWLLMEWLDRNPTSKRIGQDVKRCDEMKMIELFKYVTKLSFNVNENRKQNTKRQKKKPKPIKKSKKEIKIRKAHEFKALDTIFTAMKGKRVYNSFGIPKISEDCVTDDKIEYSDLRVELFHWYKTDWYSVKTEEPLTNYKPPKEIEDWFYYESDEKKYKEKNSFDKGVVINEIDFESDNIRFDDDI